MLLVCRFTVSDDDTAGFASDDTAGFAARATRAIEVLTAQPGCLRAVLGRSTDDADQWVLTVEFASVVAYRRAMSPFEVREHVIPLLSHAEAGAYEILADAADGNSDQRVSVVAADAATVRLGEASGPATPRS